MAGFFVWFRFSDRLVFGCKGSDTSSTNTIAAGPGLFCCVDASEQTVEKPPSKTDRPISGRYALAEIKGQTISRCRGFVLA